jgi:hypothetical protein
MGHAQRQKQREKWFGLGLGCYATPSTDTAVANAPGNKIGVASGIYKHRHRPQA